LTETPRPRDARILVVDDERVNVVLLERILEQDGYRNVKSVTDPSEAAALYDQFEPDLVLLDLHLPDMPGQEVLRRLRAEPRTAQVPVVILSADARPALIEQLLAEGVRAFLTKPLDVRELLELLDGVAAERDRRQGVPSRP
jgi:CheY-like chemotaxis protein